VWVTPERSTPYVLCFLDQLVRFYRRGPMVIITDNISTRTGPTAAQWPAQHPRVRFVFTPKHGSWLNQVEIWFGILTSQALRHCSFANVADLTRAIYRFARHWNDALAHPFEWTYTGKVLNA
jgi:transposase